MAEKSEELVEEAKDDIFQPRRRGGRARVTITHDPDFPWPDLDPEKIGPDAYAAVIDEDADRLSDVVFHLDKEKMSGLPFQPAGLPIAGKPLYTIKAIKPSGKLIQVPFEEQINNTAGGELQDAIGLRRAQRKGQILLIDFDTMAPVYCPAWGCWAKADPEFMYFCCQDHLNKTMPGRGSSAIRSGLMQGGVTTTRIWGG